MQQSFVVLHTVKFHSLDRSIHYKHVSRKVTLSASLRLSQTTHHYDFFFFGVGGLAPSVLRRV